MDIFQSSILGLVQGLTEFLPVSSTGHLILAREWLSVPAEHGLAFDAVLQLATAFAVLIYFFKDFLNVGYTALYKATGRPVRPEDERLMWALVAGTVPAIILGLALEDLMETAFRSTNLVAWTLIAGAVVMAVAEIVLSRSSRTGMVGDVTVKKAIGIGLFQSLALIPGMSRSGMTMSGGLFLGLSREAAARFAFLLSLPIILGSGGKKFFELFLDGSLASLGLPLAIASVAAFISGIAAIHLLLSFLKKHSLWPFICYRIALAALLFVVL